METRSYGVRYAATDMTTRVLASNGMRQYEPVVSCVISTHFPKMLLARACMIIAKQLAQRACKGRPDRHSPPEPVVRHPQPRLSFRLFVLNLLGHKERWCGWAGCEKGVFVFLFVLDADVVGLVLQRSCRRSSCRSRTTRPSISVIDTIVILYLDTTPRALPGWARGGSTSRNRAWCCGVFFLVGWLLVRLEGDLLVLCPRSANWMLRRRSRLGGGRELGRTLTRTACLLAVLRKK